MDSAPADRPHPRRYWILAAMSAALLAIVLNNSVLNVAIPALIADTGADVSQVQWVVDAYSVVFAAVLLPAGTLADRFGRKRLTLGGLALFGLGSAAAAAASAAGPLVAARAVMGLGAACVMPGSLAVLVHVFTGPERRRAIAVWGAVSAAGIALGPVVGGLLVETSGWPSVFLVNLPVVALTLAVGLVTVPESRDPVARPLDLPGAALGATATAAVVFAIIEAAGPAGDVGPVLTALGVAAAAGMGFVARLRTARHPLVEPSVLRNRAFLGASVSNMLLVFGLAGTLFVLTQRLQVVFGFPPLQAGLAVAPVAVAVAAGSAVVGPVANRLGARGAVGIGLALVATGTVLVAWPPGYPQVLGGLLLMGVGFGLSLAPATDAMLAGVAPGRSGTASALNDTLQELGYALGVAVVGAVLQVVYLGQSAGQPPQARGSLVGALRAAAADRRPDLAADAVHAFTTGAGAGLSVAAAVVATGAVVAALLLPGPAAPGGADRRPDDRLETTLGRKKD